MRFTVLEVYQVLRTVSAQWTSEMERGCWLPNQEVDVDVEPEVGSPLEFLEENSSSRIEELQSDWDIRMSAPGHNVRILHHKVRWPKI